MTKVETMGIMAVLKEAYPMYYKDKTKQDLTIAVNLWAEMFEDDNVNLVKAAVKRHIATDIRGFPPVIGQIKDSILKITKPDEMTEQEAWNLISKAIKNSAYNATAEYEKLPETVKQVVGSPGQLKEWGQMETGELQTVVASNFMRSYKARKANNRENEMLPVDVKKLIAAMAEKTGHLELQEAINGKDNKTA